VIERHHAHAHPIRAGLVDGKSRRESQHLPFGHGVVRGAGTRPRLVIERPDVCAWFGVGGKASLQVRRRVQRGYAELKKSRLNASNFSQHGGSNGGRSSPLRERMAQPLLTSPVAKQLRRNSQKWQCHTQLAFGVRG
jgi:hypothetical protein